MIRRIALATAAGAALAALVAGQAGAFTRLQSFCVKQARSDAKNSLAKARQDINTTYQNAVAVCLTGGGSNTCVNGCFATQKKCNDDVQSPKNPDGTVNLQASLTFCRDTCRQDNSSASCSDEACVAQAQYNLFVCNQACAAKFQAGLIECTAQFGDCLQLCATQ